jgi:hypothetical protein
MKVSVYYVNDSASREERFSALDGNLISASSYSLVSEVALPSCFEPRDDIDWRTSLCETIFKRHQAIDAPVKSSKGERIRSMSVGDYLVIEGQPGVYVCAGTGFRHEPGGPPS